ncbi:MAG: methylmalonyl-CoA epimerase [Planctomycetota bacterium]|nr:MAG: methylmalonyl-CoA epimerase [Planctomycetota bacterium]
MPNVLGVDHIAIAVKDLDAATQLWKEMGLRVGSREVVEDQGVEVQMMYAGATRIELVFPIREDSPIQVFLDKRGAGLHHLALAVDDCAAATKELVDREVRMINTEPKTGAHRTRIAFVHPKATSGVLTELVEGGEGFGS